MDACCGCTAWAPTATTSRRSCRSWCGRDWPALRFVFPHAPVRAVTINGGVRMRAWYDIRDMRPGQPRRRSRACEASIAQVEALIARESARGVPAVAHAAGRLLAGRRDRAGRGPAPRAAAGRPGRAVDLPAAGANAAAQQCTPAATRSRCSWPTARRTRWCRTPAGERSAALLRELGFAVDWHALPDGRTRSAPRRSATWATGCRGGFTAEHERLTIGDRAPANPGCPTCAGCRGWRRCSASPNWWCWCWRWRPTAARAGTWQRFVSASGFALWLALTVAVLLCVSRRQAVAPADRAGHRRWRCWARR